ncbi:hypothetical protein PNOK_0123300 [Pyrrhoderma noxium]|uniref:Uncharacterized protein n=1 Tax=Pyrrhoderma noxium TaxID=2282107 RepID=A0A286UXH6_9AGAM|nr:hypothetical protein PNOK_0123300 [Pyrrhoderma noxium]
MLSCRLTGLIATINRCRGTRWRRGSVLTVAPFLTRKHDLSSIVIPEKDFCCTRPHLLTFDNFEYNADAVTRRVLRALIEILACTAAGLIYSRSINSRTPRSTRSWAVWPSKKEILYSKAPPI